MMCLSCGKYSPEGKKCKYCGGTLISDSEYKRSTTKKKSVSVADDKEIVGFWLILVLFIIGLAIGLILYQSGDERDTFITGAAKGILTLLSIVFIIYIIVAMFNCARINL